MLLEITQRLFITRTINTSVLNTDQRQVVLDHVSICYGFVGLGSRLGLGLGLGLGSRLGLGLNHLHVQY